MTERRILRIDEAFLYRVPPLKNASGHRAEDWGLGNPTMTANLELIGIDDVLEIRIRDDSTVVAVCPVRCKKGSPPVGAIVDPVIDSSRYFVLRCEDEQQRHAYVGVGFREREVAYDFKASIQDFQRSVEREEAAAHLQPAADVDFTLKKPIKIRLGSDTDARPPRLQPEGPPLRIAPPPSSTNHDDDDFGDFEEASGA